MNLAEAVAARRSVRSFVDKTVPRASLERAVSLAVQAPAPHHSQPWRFVFLDEPEAKERLSRAMGTAWRQDLVADGLSPSEVDRIVNKSHALLTSTPVLTVCCADLARAHTYSDERRRRAEWSLFAHSVGAALQTFMTALAEDEIASCWISAPVFCGEVVKGELDLPPNVEPHALVLVGYAAPEYKPRPRPRPDPGNYILP